MKDKLIASIASYFSIHWLYDLAETYNKSYGILNTAVRNNLITSFNINLEDNCIDINNGEFSITQEEIRKVMEDEYRKH
jgi:hypothetical protein